MHNWRFRGINGFPTGFRNSEGLFYDLGDEGYWWSSTDVGDHVAWIHILDFANSGVEEMKANKVHAYTCRCIKVEQIP